MKLINRIVGYFQKYTEQIYLPRHGQRVFSNVGEFLRKSSLIRLIWLRLKRDILMSITLQRWLESAAMPPDSRRILYVYLGTPNLGDSIMDLSPRALWKVKGVAVDLFTNGAVAAFYAGDEYFQQIITDPSKLDSDYDFIVLQSYSWKCLKLKWKNFFCARFASLYGHYYGCEFNRLVYSDASWRRILGLPYVQDTDVCKPIFNSAFDAGSDNLEAVSQKKRIAVAIGGVVSWRTYKRWVEVINIVHSAMPDCEWLLLGSDNGKEDAARILNGVQLKEKLINEVGALSLSEIPNKLKSADLLLAADGGLMNMGRAKSVPMVALFSGEIHPLMRFSKCDSVIAIHAQGGVSEIQPEIIANHVIEFLSSPSGRQLASYFLDDEPVCDG